MPFEVALKSHFSSVAEFAAELAAYLGRDANGFPVFPRYEYRFDDIVAFQPECEFPGAVFITRGPFGFELSNIISGCKQIAFFLAEIGHFLNIGCVLLPEP